MAASHLDTFRHKLGEIADVGSAISLLRWDQEVNMPKKAGPGRGQQLATLSGLHHRMLTSAAIGELLDRLEDEGATLPEDDRKLVSETRYDYERSRKLPEEFVETFAAEQSKAYEVWVEARKASNFGMFRPNLARLVALLRQKAEYLGYEETPYNALLEDFERGMRADVLTALFADLATRQSALVARIMDSPDQPDLPWLNQNWYRKPQWEFTLRVLKDLGYDLDAGRQDQSVHPFSISFDVHDVRVTTRISRSDLFMGITGSLHECGHALYEQGFRESDRRTPLAGAPSLAIHESQSRLWENLVGRSLPFWHFYLPVLRKYFPNQLDHVDEQAFYRGINRVRPSFIRVEADECTYNLHVILRYEIERGLIEGSLAVDDVPAAWNQKMADLLGLDVKNDSDGCLQDIHWSHGAMGYFPTYALGNLYAAQLFEAIEKAIPDLEAQIREGEFDALLGWLRTHVHQYGRRKMAAAIVRDCTGNEPSAEPFLHYLERKYGALYGLS
jgi:carboxypeptidase Taq